MMLAAGTRLGRYEIRSLLGEGGMGEVYLAQDTKLRRPVAVKLLPADFSRDEERLRRFEQEAYAVAALNHPSIAHIYEIGEAEGTRFIAMEYVEGETLREKIHGERADLRRLVEWLAQVADGLAKAHSAGVVHRDLKPDNVMIARDGYAKILDFGLAKLVEPQKSAGTGDEAGEAATALIRQLSQPGVVMGTVGYMSPEQARGRAVDHRSDIFSFGCILFEAATGRRPFEGESVVESLHKTIRDPAPPLREHDPSLPADLQRIVRRCLAKDPEERYQSIKDVAIELRELRRELDGDSQLHRTEPPAQTGVASSGAEAATALTQQQTPQTSASGGREAETKEASAPRSTSSAEYIAGEIKRHKRGALVALALVAAAVALVGYGAYKYFGSRKKSAPALSAMSITRLTTTGKATSAAISPDGRYVVYASSDNGQQSLWMRQTATQSNVQIVAPANVVYARLIFSPDGDYLFYVTRANNVATTTLYQIPVLGGTPRLLLTNISSYMALSPDATQIVFARDFPAEGTQALMMSNVDGTAERRLAVRKLPDRAFVLGGTQNAPAWSPDGKTIACPTFNLEGGVAYNSVVAIDVASGQEKSITSQKFFTIGQLAWLADGSGLLVLAAEQVAGRVQLWQLSYPEGEVRRITNDLNSYQTISLTADSNSLVTVQSEQLSSIWIAPSSDVARAKQITNGTGRIDLYVRWTPANRIVFDSNASGQRNIWTMDADGGNQRQLTTESACCPSVSPDGSYIAFQSNRLGNFHIFRMDASGGNPKQLTNGSGEYGANFSPDGKWVLHASRAAGKITLWRVSVDGGAPQQLTNEPSYDVHVSPDGKWLATAYSEDTPNSLTKVAIIPFDGGQPVKLFDIPVGGNRQDLHWTPDSRALVYIDTRGGVSNLWMQPIDGGTPKQLTDFKTETIFSFDHSRDGKQLVVSRGTINNDVVLIKNFR